MPAIDVVGRRGLLAKPTVCIATFRQLVDVMPESIRGVAVKNLGVIVTDQGPPQTGL